MKKLRKKKMNYAVISIRVSPVDTPSHNAGSSIEAGGNLAFQMYGGEQLQKL